MEGYHPNIVVTLQGTGQGINCKCRDYYKDGVIVYWEQNMWVDIEYSINWECIHLMDI